MLVAEAKLFARADVAAEPCRIESNDAATAGVTTPQSSMQGVGGQVFVRSDIDRLRHAPRSLRAHLRLTAILDLGLHETGSRPAHFHEQPTQTGKLF